MKKKKSCYPDERNSRIFFFYFFIGNGSIFCKDLASDRSHQIGAVEEFVCNFSVRLVQVR